MAQVTHLFPSPPPPELSKEGSSTSSSLELPLLHDPTRRNPSGVGGFPGQRPHAPTPKAPRNASGQLSDAPRRTLAHLEFPKPGGQFVYSLTSRDDLLYHLSLRITKSSAAPSSARE